jgi:hypothetical protein
MPLRISDMQVSHEIDHRLLHTHQFAMVDALYREAWQGLAEHRVLAPSFLKSDTDRCPVLLDLRTVNPSTQAYWLQTLHQQAQEREPAGLSLLFQTESSIDLVAAHCTARMVVKPTLEEPKQFRYFDMGTFLQLPRLLGEVGMAWLFWPFQRITLAWAGEWIECLVPQVDAVQRSEFALGLSHYEALSRLSIVNRAAFQCPAPQSAQDWCQRCERLEAAVRKGQQYGLTQRDDLVLFALHAETQHPRFDEHPRIRQILQQLKSLPAEEELDYRELTQSFSPDDWKTLIDELKTDKVSA